MRIKRILDNGKKFADGTVMRMKANKNIKDLATSSGGELDANKGLDFDKKGNNNASTTLYTIRNF